MKKKNCQDCKHFFVCAYMRFHDNLMDLALNIGIGEIANDDSSREWAYTTLGSNCKYFNKDCYSKLSCKK